MQKTHQEQPNGGALDPAQPAGGPIRASQREIEAIAAQERIQEGRMPTMRVRDVGREPKETHDQLQSEYERVWQESSPLQERPARGGWGWVAKQIKSQERVSEALSCGPILKDMLTVIITLDHIVIDASIITAVWL